MPEGQLPKSKQRLLDLLTQVSMVFLCTSLVVRPLTSGFTIGLELTLLFQFFTLLSGLMWLSVMVLKRELKVVLPGIGIPLAVFALSIVVSVFRASCMFLAAATAFDWIVDLLLFLLVLQLARDSENRQTLIRVCLATAFVVAVYGLIQYFKGFPEMKVWIEANTVEAQKALGIFDPINWNDLKSRLYTDEVFSTFVIANALGGYLVMILPLQLADLWVEMLDLEGTFLCRLKRCLRKPSFIVKAMAFVLVLFCLSLTGAKGAWICIPIQIAVFAFFLGNAVSRRRRLLVIGGVGASILAGILIIGIAWLSKGNSISDRILGAMFGLWDSLYVRLGYWDTSLQILKTDGNFLLGVGANNFQEAFPVFKTVTSSEVQKAHNHYLQLIVELGIAGGAAFVAMWSILFIRASKSDVVDEDEAAPHCPRKTMAFPACGIGFLCVVVYADAFRNIPSSTDNVVIGVLLAGLWCAFFAISGSGVFSSSLSNTWIKAAILSGLSGMLLHSVIDFDLYVAGCAQSLWLLGAIAISLQAGLREKTFKLTPVWQAILMFSSLLGFVILTSFVFPRVTESAGLKASAQGLIQNALASKDNERRALGLQAGIHQLQLAQQLNPLDPEIPFELSAGYQHVWFTSRSVDAALACVESMERASALAPLRGGYHHQLAQFLQAVAATHPKTVTLHLKNHFSVRDEIQTAPEAFRPALSHYAQARELYPSKPTARLPEADLLWGLKMKDKAREKYSEILEIDDQIHPRWRNLKLSDEVRLRIELRLGRSPLKTGEVE
jgi:O-antigen ligase